MRNVVITGGGTGGGSGNRPSTLPAAMPSLSDRALVTRPILIWAAVAFAARVPVAMAPLAFVFLVRSQPGGYALGAELAGALMYAAVGVGYAASATLSGVALSVASPSVAILCGVALTLLLTLISALGDRKLISTESSSTTVPTEPNPPGHNRDRQADSAQYGRNRVHG